MLLSILTPTLESRASRYAALRSKLMGQVRKANALVAVELISLRDAGERPTGEKRNRLIAQARGRFVASVDDDDDVHDEYVSLLLTALRSRPDVDCLGIRGHVTYRGRRKRPFVYSTRFPRYRTRHGTYERPPHHLNPILRSIALRFPFEPVTLGEDAEWALRIARHGVLRREYFIDTPLYDYRSRRHPAYQELLDATETFRHSLGIQRANIVRLRRALRLLLSAWGGVEPRPAPERASRTR